jgi:hypothetical protein
MYNFLAIFNIRNAYKLHKFLWVTIAMVIDLALLMCKIINLTFIAYGQKYVYHTPANSITSYYN